MRRNLLTVLLAMSPAVVAAQRDSVPAQLLPRDVRREIVDRWNGANAVRSSERLEINPGQEVVGDVAVLRGPLIIGGHITGNVLAVNSDVILRSTARIDGQLLVVGGEVEGRNASRVDGAIRIYRQSLAYREDGQHIVAANEEAGEDESWWRRLEHHHEGNWSEALRVVQAGPYNRVEGLPVELGPVINRRTSWGSVRFDAAAVVRTGSSFRSEQGDYGHNVRGEVRMGQDRGIGIGARLFSVVDPVERWQLTDLEVALGSFLARRDYRDYYQRHGGAAFVTLYGARDVNLTASFGQERWSSRAVSDPFTVFNDGRTWRPNPVVDEGLFHIGNVTLNIDTRTDPDDPSSGWFVNADVEHGRGAIISTAPTSDARTFDPGKPNDYTRGLFDFRRYNRLGPDAQLNMRIVLGGWLGGDALPLERRFSVTGPGSLPGFGFKDSHAGFDVGTCNVGFAVPGQPAECERVALAQIEYRGDLRLDFTGDWEDWPRHYHSSHGDVVWVMFADVGRGWNAGPSTGSIVRDQVDIPPLSTFRSDIGLGLDFGGIGVYAAKAVSAASEPVNFFVRLRHRF
ncbi:MAG: hypothetical protein ABJF01_24955 [bacterium]